MKRLLFVSSICWNLNDTYIFWRFVMKTCIFQYFPFQNLMCSNMKRLVFVSSICGNLNDTYIFWRFVMKTCIFHYFPFKGSYLYMCTCWLVLVSILNCKCLQCSIWGHFRCQIGGNYWEPSGNCFCMVLFCRLRSQMGCTRPSIGDQMGP